MKKLIFLFAFIAISQISFSQNRGSRGSKASKSHSKHGMQKSKLRHVVLFKFKDGTSAGDVKKVEDAFRDLPKKIKQIVGYEWGTNNSPEGLSQGFTHCFFLSFNSEEDRAIYLPHPDHKAFGGVLGPHLDKVLVVDYWTKD
jgi:Stress responsive A/B Barrel Domain